MRSSSARLYFYLGNLCGVERLVASYKRHLTQFYLPVQVLLIHVLYSFVHLLFRYHVRPLNDHNRN